MRMCGWCHQCAHHQDLLTWVGAAAHLPAYLCGVLTLLVASSCAVGCAVGQIAAAFCRGEASRAGGSGSAAACLP